MSVFRERAITCGGCGAKSVWPVALSIHGGRAPELLQQIRAGTFHRFRCEACGAETIVDGPLLVMDLEQPWWVQLYPRAWASAWRAAEVDAQRRFDESIARDAPAEIRALAPGFTRRITFGMDGLREKLLLREAGIDDVTVETAKLMTIAAHPEGGVPVLRVDELDEAALYLVGAPGGRLRVDRAGLATLAADPTLAATRARVSEGLLVDALRVFEPGRAALPFAAR